MRAIQFPWWVLPTALAMFCLIAYVVWETTWSKNVRTDMAFVDAKMVYITAQQSGIVLSLYAQELSEISTDQPILQLDDSSKRYVLANLLLEEHQWQQQLESNENQLAMINHRIELLEFEISVAKLDLSMAQVDQSRVQQLFDKGQIHLRDHQHSIHHAQTAHINLQKLLSEKKGLLLQTDHWRIQLDIIKQDLEKVAVAIQEVRWQISQFTVISPIQGIVSHLRFQPGEFVKSGDTLATVVPSEAVWIEAYFKESLISRISAGQSAEIVIDAYPNIYLEGEVIAVSPLAGAKHSIISPQYTTGNVIRIEQRVPVRIRVDNAHSLELRPGLSARVSIKSPQ